MKTISRTSLKSLKSCTFIATLSAFPAFAATLVLPISSGTFNSPPTIIGTFGVPQFDPSLGRLDRITIDANSLYTYSLVAQNLSAVSASVTYGYNALVRVSLGIPSQTIQSRVNRSTQGVFVPANGVVFLPSDSFTIPLASSFTYTDSVSLAAMTGTGQTPASILDLSEISEFPANNTILFSATLAFSVNGSICYDYTPVPEPSTVFLGIVGAVGLAGRRMRDTNSSSE